MHHDALWSAADALTMDPWAWVLAGGEDHALVATFPGTPPAGWGAIGRVCDGAPGVLLDGEQWHGDTGWQSF
jgi:thiamine-monophosphate kinase